ncbi:MAG: TIGR00304 family membrane protein [Candidatus Methanomethylicaceae archaeon]
MANDAIAFIFFGVFLIIAGLMLLALKNKGKVEGGALIMVGPFPIVLGSSVRIVKALIILGIALFFIIMLFTVM